jgi:hypothetical protein
MSYVNTIVTTAIGLVGTALTAFIASAFVRPKTFAYLARPAFFTFLFLSAVSSLLVIGMYAGVSIFVAAFPPPRVEPWMGPEVTLEMLKEGKAGVILLGLKAVQEYVAYLAVLSIGSLFLSAVTWLLTKAANNEIRLKEEANIRGLLEENLKVMQSLEAKASSLDGKK